MNKIDFEIETEKGVYRDALHLTDAELSSLSKQDIEAMKQARVDNWLAVISSQVQPEEPQQ
jgi:hypothetical protein